MPPSGSDLRRSAVLQVALEGVPLPAARKELLDYAKGQDGADDLLDTLRSLPDGQYDHLDEVGEAIASTQPAFDPPDVHTPQVESGDVPGGESYLTAHGTPGEIRGEPDVLLYEEQLVRKPGGEIPKVGEKDRKPKSP